MSNTEQTRELITRMVSALNDHVIDGQDSFWHDDATWRGPVGAGVKPSLQAFKDGWQKPFLNAFPDKVTTDAVVLADGEWAAAFGEVEATHSNGMDSSSPKRHLGATVVSVTTSRRKR